MGMLALPVYCIIKQVVLEYMECSYSSLSRGIDPTVSLHHLAVILLSLWLPSHLCVVLPTCQCHYKNMKWSVVEPATA